jgi:hypothetical protein
MAKIVFLFSILGILSLIAFPIMNASAEHIFEDNLAFGQYLDIAQLEAEKYTLVVDEQEFVIYYGWGGSLEMDIEEIEYPTVSSMTINQERKSLQVNFEDAPEETVMWIRISFDVMTAEDEQYQLLIDGKQTGYDLTKFPNDYSVGMILPEGTRNLEIIGTNVIPEFGSITIAVLGITIFAIVFVIRGKSRFFNYN